MTTRYPDKAPGESVVVTFDFSKEATAVSGPSVTCTVLWTESDTPDPTPENVRSGEPEVSGSNAAHVLQRVVGGEDMTDYAMTCTATSSAGDVLTVPAVLPVRIKPK
jgi:hypothetical protein